MMRGNIIAQAWRRDTRHRDGLWGLEVILGIRGHQKSRCSWKRSPPHPIGQIKTFFFVCSRFCLR